jgi:hypothetical protein
MTPPMSELESLVGRLESIVEELDELAFDRLRLAAAEGSTARPAADKAMVRARRAVEKAVHALRSIDDQAPEASG